MREHRCQWSRARTLARWKRSTSWPMTVSMRRRSQPFGIALQVGPAELPRQADAVCAPAIARDHAGVVASHQAQELLGSATGPKWKSVARRLTALQSQWIRPRSFQPVSSTPADSLLRTSRRRWEPARVDPPAAHGMAAACDLEYSRRHPVSEYRPQWSSGEPEGESDPCRTRAVQGPRSGRDVLRSCGRPDLRV